MEKPHTELDDCLNMLLACFRKRMSDRDKLMWFWDDNQYDLLVELTTERIEILELRYGDASYNETRDDTYTTSANISDILTPSPT